MKPTYSVKDCTRRPVSEATGAAVLVEVSLGSVAVFFAVFGAFLIACAL